MRVGPRVTMVTCWGVGRRDEKDAYTEKFGRATHLLVRVLMLDLAHILDAHRSTTNNENRRSVLDVLPALLECIDGLLLGLALGVSRSVMRRACSQDGVLKGNAVTALELLADRHRLLGKGSHLCACEDDMT